MKSAKSYKFIILIVAFVMSICACVFSMVNSNVAYGASSASKPLDYFAVNNNGQTAVRELSFADSFMVAKVKTGDVLSVKRKLVVNDFSLEYDLDSASFASVKFRLKTNSYYVNGNKNSQGGFDKEIVIERTLDLTDKVVDVSVIDGVVSIDGNSYGNAYNRVDAIDKAIATVEFEFELNAGVETADFKIKSINQKASDSDKKFEQLFTVDADGKLNDKAYPRVELEDKIFTKNNESGVITNKLVMMKNDINQLSLTSYSVLGDVASSAVYLKKTDVNDGSVGLNNVDKPKKIQFRELGVKNFAITYDGITDGDTLETYAVNVVDSTSDNSAPYYKVTAEALEGFEYALNKAVKGEDGTSIYLGAKLELPSLSDLVFDDVKAFSKLTATINYSVDDLATAQSDSFTIKKTGDYKFFVTFSDGTNEIEKKDFYETSEEDSNVIVKGKYFDDFVFEFKVLDDHDILIEVSGVEGLGYKGVKYTASKFKIDAEGCTTSYKLYYSNDTEANVENDDAWVEIPAVSKATKNDTFDDGVNFALVEDVAYDGKLTFNPTKTGSYKIVCTATSTYTTRSAEETLAIRVLDKATTVELPNYWLRDNVWSVVFLSVGTLSLIGIIVLLCIKPKDETESD